MQMIYICKEFLMVHQQYKNKEWFVNWFDSEYYPMLYMHRDDAEADLFLENLQKYLQLPEGAKVLDLACGRGRHSRKLASMNYQVTGLDISAESIADAVKLTSGNNPEYAVHDMRTPFGKNRYDAVLNLFTSFGYFDNTDENKQVLENIFSSLITNGILVLDFFNSSQVLKNLVQNEIQQRNQVVFNITRTIENGFVIKTIEIKDGDHSESHTERVQLFNKQQLTDMLHNAGFVVNHFFGDYGLSPYKETDARVILTARKP